MYFSARPQAERIRTYADRFMIGFGLTFAAAAAPLLVTEIAFPTQRAQATSMYNTLWSVPSFIESRAHSALSYSAAALS